MILVCLLFKKFNKRALKLSFISEQVFQSEDKMKFPGLIVKLTLILAAITESALGIQVSGNVSGTWSPTQNPYEVVGNLSVLSGQNLTIQPGVIVRFLGQYEFRIQSGGTLIANGTQEDSITFTGNASLPWLYLYFYVSSAQSSVSFCIFEYGGSTNTTTGFGAVTIDSSTINIQNCTFRYNHSKWGGGIYCRQHGTGNISNSVFHNNTADSHGGALGFSYYSTGNINNCVFYNNTASGSGGAIYNYNNSFPTFNNCEFYGNISNDTATPTGYGGGAFHSNNSRLVLNYCSIHNNTANSGSGGGICGTLTTMNINRTLIYANTASEEGGGIASYHTDNTDTTYLTNCDIFGNTAGTLGGGVRETSGYDAQTLLHNSIIWANNAPTNPQYAYVSRIYYCDLSQTAGGQGNINQNPLFIDPGSGNFNLQASSPCIDAGNPDPIYNDPDGTRCDMGAIYFPQTISIVLEPDTLQFDSTDVGETTNMIFFAVNNFGISAVVDSISCISTAFSVPSAGFTVPSNDSVEISAEFTPPGSGEFYGFAVCYSNGETDTLFFHGVGVGGMNVIPSEIYFGNKLIGLDTAEEVWVRNPTADDLEVITEVFESSFSVEPSSFTAPANDSVSVAIHFIPDRNGAINDSIVFSAPLYMDYVLVSGSGYGFSIYPASLNFGSVGVSSSDTMTIAARNQGLISIDIDSIQFITQTYSVFNSPASIPAQDTIDIEIIFSPSISGTASDTAKIFTTVGSFSIPLTGFGVGWLLDPDTLDFGINYMGQWDTLYFQVENFEGADLVVDSMKWIKAAYSISPTAFTVPGSSSQAVQVVAHSFQSGYHNDWLNVYTNRGTGQVRLILGIVFSGVERPQIPVKSELLTVRPNPFNAELNITISLERDELAEVSVWNIMGERICTLAEGKLTAGTHTYKWDSKNNAGGVYFIRVRKGNEITTEKAALLK